MNIESNIKKELASAKRVKQSVLFPQVRRFDELFESARVIRLAESTRSNAVHTWTVDQLLFGGKVGKGRGRAELDAFCAVYCSDCRYSHLHIQPRADVIEAIEKNMLLADQYRINFQINVRDVEQGTALISAHYNMICGSRWFAIIDASTIPR